MTAYLGGKWRQGPAIAEHVARLAPPGGLYVEPFCGMLGAASRVARARPDLRLELSDANPHVVAMWRAILERGWEPPARATVADWKRLRDGPKRIGDPLVAFLGYGSSFAGKFFRAPPVVRNGRLHLGRNVTVLKARLLRGAVGITVSLRDYREVRPRDATVYLDPPYPEKLRRIAHRHLDSVKPIDQEEYWRYARALARHNVVLATRFGKDRAPWRERVLHEYGENVQFQNAAHQHGKRVAVGGELLVQVLG